MTSKSWKAYKSMHNADDIMHTLITKYKFSEEHAINLVKGVREAYKYTTYDEYSESYFDHYEYDGQMVVIRRKS